MTLRADAADALVAMGWKIDLDFVAHVEHIEWLSVQPMPSEAEINAFDMSTDAVAAREDAKEPLLADLFTQAAGAIADNNTFLAITSPTNAQVIAQTKRLCQQNNRIIRGLFRVIQRTWRNGKAAP